MKAPNDISIHDAGILLGHAETPDADIIGIVTYEGDIGNAEPLYVYLDTQDKKLSVIFNNGGKSELCDLSPENVAVINGIYEDITKGAKPRKSLTVDFNQVDPAKTGTAFFKRCYRVDAMVI